MLRLILALFMLAAVAMAIAGIVTAWRIVSPQGTAQTGDTMPKTFSMIAYLLLILLMLGVTSGLLGAA